MTVKSSYDIRRQGLQLSGRQPRPPPLQTGINVKILKIPPEWQRILIDEFFSLSLRRIWASSPQQFPRKSMLKSQMQLSQYDRCQTQRPKEFKQCRPFQIYQSALGYSRIFGFRVGKPWEAKRWLVDLKLPALLEFLSIDSLKPRTHRVVCLCSHMKKINNFSITKKKRTSWICLDIAAFWPNKWQ